MAFLSALQNTERTAASHGCLIAACIRRLPTGESGQSGTGTAASILTSGWVMKCTMVMVPHVSDDLFRWPSDRGQVSMARCGHGVSGERTATEAAVDAAFALGWNGPTQRKRAI